MIEARPTHTTRTALLTTLLWVLLVSPASAADKLVSVMTLLNESGDDTAALELTDALRAGARSLDGWVVNDTQMSLSQLGLVHDCEPTEAQCLEVIAEAIDAGLILVGTLEPGGGKLLTVRLQLYERGGGFREDMARADFTAANADYAALAMSLLRQLQPEEAAAAPVPAPADVAQQGTDEPQPDMAAIEMSIPDPQESSLAWLGYTLLGVSAASLGLVAYSWLKINEAQEDTTFVAYREQVGTQAPGVDDVCAEADSGNTHGVSDGDLAQVKDLCSQGELFDLLQYVFLGTAVAAGAAGGIVLWQDGGDSESASITLSPRVTRERIGLAAQLRL